MEGSSKKGKGLMGTHVSLDDCGARELGRGGRYEVWGDKW